MFKKLISFFKRPMVLLVISAILSALPMTFPKAFLLCWISFIPFFIILVEGGKRRFWSSVGRGVLFGFIYHCAIYYWFLWMHPMDFAGFSNGLSIVVVFFAWLGISLVHGSLFAIPTVLCYLVSKKIKSAPLIVIIGVTGILFALRLTQMSELSFPWVRIALSQYRAPAMIQLASVFGVEGVDFLILTVNALIAICLISPPKKRRVFAAVAALLFLCNIGFGLYRLSNDEDGNKIKVSALQGCVLSGEKWGNNRTKYCLDTYTSLTKEAARLSPDLILWPESAVPVNLYRDTDYLDDYKELSNDISTPILMGAFWKLNGITTNSSVYIDSSTVLEPYHKRQLVPFGETMPYKSLISSVLPFLEEINTMSRDLAAGSDTAVMHTSNGSIGNIICLEATFPQLARQTVSDGAQVLVNLTNDSWLKDSPAVSQHLAHAVFRSVENSRSTVRCANSGISAFIDTRGRITAELGAMKKGVLTETVSLSDETTPYTKMGNILLPIMIVIEVIWCALILILNRKSKNAED